MFHATPHADKKGVLNWMARWVFTPTTKDIGTLYLLLSLTLFFLGGFNGHDYPCTLVSCRHTSGHTQHLQRTRHFARLNHDIRRHHACVCGLSQLDATPYDRRTGYGTPALE